MFERFLGLVRQLFVYKVATIFFIISALAGFYVASSYLESEPVKDVPTVVPEVMELGTYDFRDGASIYERYTARVDRVEVMFEQKDYQRYRLTTNELVREGELNTERGYEDDIDATVYVLNWQQPEGQQMRYVRFTNEPDRIYVLDSALKVVRGGALLKEDVGVE